MKGIHNYRITIQDFKITNFLDVQLKKLTFLGKLLRKITQFAAVQSGVCVARSHNMTGSMTGSYAL